ncbi:MAG: phBC6A51 family helix-turn-helix protein [Candidatus Paceibacterota bacterium]
MSKEKTIEKRQEIRKKLIVEQLEKTPIVETSCQKVGIGRSTYYRWRKEDSEFAKRADKALFIGKLLVNDMAESQLMSLVKEKNLSAVKFWLRNNHPQYARKLNINAHLKHERKELTDEQKEIVRKALTLAKLNSPDHD